MAKAKIGIWYCGGCNPHYERVEMIQRVQSLAGGRFLFIRNDQQDPDGIIMVSGCPRACVAKERHPREVPYYSVAEKDDFDGLMEWLFTFERKET